MKVFKIYCDDELADERNYYTEGEATCQMNRLKKFFCEEGDEIDIEPDKYRIHEIEIPSEMRVTTAPIEYDGLGTRHIAQMKHKIEDQIYRVVDIPNDALIWQETRYASGLHLVFTLGEFEKKFDFPIKGIIEEIVGGQNETQNKGKN